VYERTGRDTWLKNIDGIKAMKEDLDNMLSKGEVIELMRDWIFVNPTLVESGYGEFPDSYKLSDKNLQMFENRIHLIEKQDA
jgi:hypothetical protein